jgi:hypothetical protein
VNEKLQQLADASATAVGALRACAEQFDKLGLPSSALAVRHQADALFRAVVSASAAHQGAMKGPAS